MSFYLLEIGCEELPAAFIDLACRFMENEVKSGLDNLHLPYSKVISDGTPKRLYLYINGIPEKQDDRTEVVQGPPAKIAFNPDGTLSHVGEKFIESKALNIATVKRITTDKGEYLSANKDIAGVDTGILMSDLITGIIKSIPFPKSMRWGSRDMRFARPVRYFLSIYKGKILPLGIEGFEASNKTAGHRFLSSDMIVISSFEQYKSVLRDMNVVVDTDDRISIIKKQMEQLANSGGYTVDEDEQLLKTVANLVEYPHCIEGHFDSEFLDLPARVLITSMKNHQKYFPVYSDGKLQSAFIGVSNTLSTDDSLIRQGYERVLRARLNDAMFFYNNDKAVPLENRVEMLKKVLYQEKLGTSYEKMERFRELACFLAEKTVPTVKEDVYGVSTLCKADLMCEMVYEFPELQGFMGNIYARIQGKTEDFALAIEEHYMPKFAGDLLPSTAVGKIVAVADKLDTIAGAFSIGMIPTGNVDPYGLRRNAIGIINIIEEAGWRISLKDLVNKSLELLKGKSTEDLKTTFDKIMSFFMQRQKQLLINRQEADADAIDAALPLYDDIIEIRLIAQALTNAKKSTAFAGLSEGFKRINNILKKSNPQVNAVDETMFTTEQEKVLYSIYLKKKDSVNALVKRGMWVEALEELSEFSVALAAFFENVMVMSDDIAVRNNRLGILKDLHSLFTVTGDLSKII